MEKKTFCAMIDCSRNGVMQVNQVKRFMDYIQPMGYNAIMLYTEDTFEVENEPFFGYLRGAYTQDEIRSIVEYGEAKGMEVIPCIQTLAHLPALHQWREYDKIWDIDDILLIDEPRVYELIRNMFATLRKCYKTNRLHIGMDEAEHVGLGKFLQRHGYQKPMEILLRHMNKVVEIAEEFGFKPMIWSDMLFRLKNNGEYHVPDTEIDDELKAMVPENLTLVYWSYNLRNQPHYEGMLDAHKKFERELWFAGGVWNWVGFAPGTSHIELTMVHAMAACREKEVENVILTMWCDGGAECSAFACLDALLKCRMIYDNEDLSLLPERFEKIVGMPLADYQKLQLPNLVAGNDNAVFNPSRYALYNDAFAGYLDPNLLDGGTEDYGKHVKALAQVDKTHYLGPMFESMEQLCRVMEIKYDLGKRLRKAYQAGDKQELTNLLDDMDELVSRIEDFHTAFFDLWHWVYKPYGFELQDVRLGGLQRRIRTCRKRLAAYLNGEVDAIEELEVTLLKAFPNGEKPSIQDIWCNSWHGSVSVNIVGA